MNYEELLNAREAEGMHADQMPFGSLRKELIDNKYHYVLKMPTALTERWGFSEAIEAEQRLSRMLRSKQQLHFEMQQDAEGASQLVLEPGTYQTLAQLLNTNPAIMAKSGFVDSVVSGLFDITEELHEHGVFHVCFSPQNVLIRKGSDNPLLLLHASSFAKSGDVLDIFAGMDDFLAPELKEGKEMGIQSDIYSIGKLMEALYQQGSIPFEYKKVAQKATQLDPQKRYATVAEMREALNARRSMKRTFLSLVAALIVTACCVGLYFELLPEPTDVEFVEAAPKTPETDMLDDDSFSKEMEMLIEAADSIDTLTVEEREEMETYMKKAEEIFRKQFTQKADNILSKVYSNERMSDEEKTFMAGNNAMRDELLKAESELAEQAGISEEKAGRIMTEVLNQLYYEKQKAMRQMTSPGSGTKY